jgi:tetratricopeptide (TPR) repeat protein
MTRRHWTPRAPGILALAIAALCGRAFGGAPPPDAAAQTLSGVPASVIAADKASESKGLLFLGNSLTERADYGAAEIAYRQVLNSPDFKPADKKDALIAIARMYRRAGLFTKAAAINEKFLKEFPEDVRAPDVLLDQGRVLRSMGAYKMAINRFYSVIDSTLKLQTENFDHYQQLAKTAQFEIAETHFASGNFVEAGKFFARLRLLDLAPADRARAHFKSAYSLQLAGDLEGSVTTLRAYLEQWPEDENVPEARYLLATTLLQLKRPDESLAATLALLQGPGDELGRQPEAVDLLAAPDRQPARQRVLPERRHLERPRHLPGSGGPNAGAGLEAPRHLPDRPLLRAPAQPRPGARRLPVDRRRAGQARAGEGRRRPPNPLGRHE